MKIVSKKKVFGTPWFSLPGRRAAYFMTTQLDALAKKEDFLRHLSRYPVKAKADRYVVYELGAGGRP